MSSFIPTQVDDIDASWLGIALFDDSTSVIAVDAERFGQGVGILGELARLRPTYAEGVEGPATLVAKCQSPAPENQFLAQAMGFYVREVSFYRDVADTLPIRVPHAYHAECGPDGLPFVLLIEDIAGARCPDQIAGISVDDATRILSVVAELHATFWDSPRLAEMQWLPPMNNPMYQGGLPMALERLPAYRERFGERIGAEMMDAIDTGCHHYVELLHHVADRDHLTLTHTDCRAENYLFGGSAGDDAVTMIDFQLTTKHFGPWDVANLVGGSLQPDVRRAHETTLVEGYHAALVERGVTGYSLDQCWDDYRMSLIQMCVASVIVSDLDGGNDRGDELMEQLLLRPVMAGIDHGVHDLLPRFVP